MDWPFAFVVGPDRRWTGWAAIQAPIVSPSRQEQFAVLRRGGARFVGFTSDGAFPEGESAIDYRSVCEAWCHCLRDPDPVLGKEAPRALISQSDFTDPAWVSPERFPADGSFDVVHVSASVGWKRDAKNWPLARASLLRLSRKLGLSCLAVGIEPDQELARAGICCTGALPWDRLMAKIASARLLLVASTEDASPRILAEALCLDTPILVNRKILGGWKYVNGFTGAFFDDPDAAAGVARSCLSRPLHPRAWFAANHGPVRAGNRLQAFLSGIDPELVAYERLELVEALSATD